MQRLPRSLVDFKQIHRRSTDRSCSHLTGVTRLMQRVWRLKQAANRSAVMRVIELPTSTVMEATHALLNVLRAERDLNTLLYFAT